MRDLFRTLCLVLALLCQSLAGMAQDNATDFHDPDTTTVAATQPTADSITPAVAEFFPKATHLIDLGHGWIAVMKTKKHLGYIAYSKPASDSITGYRGETPLLIAFNDDHTVRGVRLLPNRETPGFVKRVEDAGFLDSWNGLKIKKAIDKTPDAVSGATYTSRSIAASMKAALVQLSHVTPTVASQSSPWGTILIIVAVLLIIWLLRKKWVTIWELLSEIPGLDALYFLDIFRKDKKKKTDTAAVDKTTPSGSEK